MVRPLDQQRIEPLSDEDEAGPAVRGLVEREMYGRMKESPDAMNADPGPAIGVEEEAFHAQDAVPVQEDEAR